MYAQLTSSPNHPTEGDTMLRLTIQGDGITMLEKAAKVLGSDAKARRAYARALNDVGRPAVGKAVGAVAKQMGVSRAVVAKRADLKRFPATGGKLDYKLTVAGGYLLMKDFKPAQGGKGTRAGPWAKRRMFKGAFMGPKPGAMARKLNGNVFHRAGAPRQMTKGAYKGKMRQPIENMFGPAVPKEIVKDKSAETWKAYVEPRLEKRMAHHVKQITNGVLS